MDGIERVQGEPWEDEMGFSRAVAAGDRVVVSGGIPFVRGVLQGEGDPYEQGLASFRNALDAIAKLGVGIESVIRTRMYIAHARDVDEAGRAHKELFDAVRPAGTLVVVSGFIDSRILVEVELEAYRGES
ncbi:Rid family hydrolase [Streptomyces sp. NPDC051940]|uniref:Rid family hydrolase n=1 Tax=Streptomyces sp. NPDC051940 TaxID=3155675 RepID=UPI003428E35E